jgi:hypothetical protein
MSLRKIELNNYRQWKGRPTFEFVVEVLPTALEFMNISKSNQMTNILVVRYEDMRLQPELAMTRILNSLGPRLMTRSEMRLLLLLTKTRKLKRKTCSAINVVPETGN